MTFKPFLSIAILTLSVTTAFCTEKSNAKADTAVNANNSAIDNIPENKLLLENLINETKSKLDQDNKNLQLLLIFAKQLDDYKIKVNGISNDTFDVFFNEVKKKEDEKTKYNKLSNAYLSLYSSFYFENYLIRNNSDFDEVYNSKLGFKSAISNQIKTFFIPINSILENSDDSKKSLTSEDYKTIEDFFSQNKALSLKSLLLKTCDDKIQEINKSLEIVKARAANENNYLSRLYDKFNQQETQINSLAIKLGLPLFCATILLLFLGPKLLKHLFKSQDEGDNNSQNLVEISTVLLLTMSILILGLSEKIKGDVLGTLIGGISGYVLNKINKQTSSK